MPCHVANVLKKPRGFEAPFKRDSLDLHRNPVEMTGLVQKRVGVMILLTVPVVCGLLWFGRTFRRILCVTFARLLHRSIIS